MSSTSLRGAFGHFLTLQWVARMSGFSIFILIPADNQFDQHLSLSLIHI